MTIASSDSGLFKRFRQNPLPFQRTFATPLNDLDNFVGGIFESLGEVNNKLSEPPA
jgi:hypothetical protein